MISRLRTFIYLYILPWSALFSNLLFQLCPSRCDLRVSEVDACTSELSSNKPQVSSSNKPVPTNCKHNHTKFTKEQLKILISAFNQNCIQVMLPNKNLLWKSTLKSQVSKFGFKILELGIHFRKYQNIRRFWNQVKALGEITFEKGF